MHPAKLDTHTPLLERTLDSYPGMVETTPTLTMCLRLRRRPLLQELQFSLKLQWWATTWPLKATWKLPPLPLNRVTCLQSKHRAGPISRAPKQHLNLLSTWPPEQLLARGSIFLPVKVRVLVQASPISCPSMIFTVPCPSLKNIRELGEAGALQVCTCSPRPKLGPGPWTELWTIEEALLLQQIPQTAQTFLLM